MSRPQIRKIARKLLPPMFGGDSDDGEGAKVVYTVALAKDAALEWVLQGVMARFPVALNAAGPRAHFTALPYIGRERQILRGPDEGEEPYRVRLSEHLDARARQGSPFAIMQQLTGYLTPHAASFSIVSTDNGNTQALWMNRAADGTETYNYESASNWDWDGDSASWWRFWVIVHTDGAGSPWSESPGWGDAALFGGAWGTEGYCWGSNDLTPSDVSAMRAIVAFWKAAVDDNAQLYIILSFDPTQFDPTGAPGLPLPDGQWGQSHKNSAPATHARLTNAAYIPGVAT